MAEGVRGKRDVFPLGQQEWLHALWWVSNAHGQLKRTPNKQGFAECNWLQRLLGLTHVRTDPFVVKPGVQRQNCNGITVCAHSPGEQSNARSSPRLPQAIDLRRHAQALCNCLHEADLRCQLGYQISKDFPLGAAKMGNQRQFHAKQSSLPRHLIDQLGVRQFILA